MEKERAPRNRTLTISENERNTLKKRLFFPNNKEEIATDHMTNKTICGNLFEIIDLLPAGFVDLLIIDPPYNLDKDFNGLKFSKTNDEVYLDYLKSWFPKIIKTLKPAGSVYICGDWKSTFCLYQIMRDFTIIRNRIIWQREKGRGAKANWKNATEDIWFGTKGEEYYFNVEAVKQKRKVIAPYRENGKPKDWEETVDGNFRLTCPSNFWDDISIPYWSMPENTDHPTQKPEKLIAKLLLASCPENGMVLDPFLGSGTTSVVAKKLNRRYAGIEINEEYCYWAEKRLLLAEDDSTIQGYSSGVFWERNTLNLQMKENKKIMQNGTSGQKTILFEEVL
ncbi:MAG: site-specific DNA-methyltransferase [Spirochaetales bacterium]|jgi:site-specific DNA-methyltransferase (adenine-specific)|nr:site-specific DNA-methyltransferase [Spirochaetales bacterium]